MCYRKRERVKLLLFSFEITHTEKLWQAIIRISLLTVCLDKSFARDIMVKICKSYCCKDVNASALCLYRPDTTLVLTNVILQKVKSPHSDSSAYVDIVVSYLFTKCDQFLCNIHLLRRLKISAKWPVTLLLPAPNDLNFERLSIS